VSNEVKVTVTGNAGKDPVIRRSSSGTEWTTFPVASTRRIRGTHGEFYDGPTIWFQVKAWGHAAVNICDSVKKGQPVVVAGRLEVEEWGDEARRRTSLVINADTVGPNLMKGTAAFRRVIPSDEPGTERPSGPGEGGMARGTAPAGDPWAAIASGREAPVIPDDPGGLMDGDPAAGEPSGPGAPGTTTG
jgi:single-strand DNA-binding protein